MRPESSHIEEPSHMDHHPSQMDGNHDQSHLDDEDDEQPYDQPYDEQVYDDLVDDEVIEDESPPPPPRTRPQWRNGFNSQAKHLTRARPFKSTLQLILNPWA